MSFYYYVHDNIIYTDIFINVKIENIKNRICKGKAGKPFYNL